MNPIRGGQVVGVVLTLVPMGVLIALTTWAGWDGSLIAIDVAAGGLRALAEVPAQGVDLC